MKTVFTVGPKCECGFGNNSGVPLVEQADIDAAIAEVETEMGRPATDFEKAMIALPIKKQGAFGVSEESLRRDQLRQATFILAAHVNEDGSCPGRVGEYADAYKPERAQPKNFEQRLDLAEKVLARHGGKTRGDEPSMTLDEVKAEKIKEKARPK